MKRLRSKEAKLKAQELAKAIEERRVAMKKELLLKKYFKAQMAEEHIAIVGPWVITLDEKVRHGLDRNLLEEEFGERIYEFETTTKYTVLMIRSI